MQDPKSNILESAIYKGTVRHRRFSPTQHEFEYPLFMFLLNAKEIPVAFSRFWQLGISRFSLARFRRSDYIGNDSEPVQTSVVRKIAELSGKCEQEIEGEVLMLVHLRYFGFYFSPLNVYYLRHNDEFQYMLAEVSNTPWNERHYYLQDLKNIMEQEKQFHVSPFNPMNQKYRWKILPPDPDHGHCSIHLQCHDIEDANDSKVFDATLQLNRTELNQAQLRSVLLRTPMQTLSVVIGIYWQALKLFIKGTPLYKHPRKLEKGIVEKSGENTA